MYLKDFDLKDLKELKEYKQELKNHLWREISYINKNIKKLEKTIKEKTIFEKEIIKDICKKHNVDILFLKTPSREIKIMNVKKDIAKSFRDLNFTLERIASLLWLKTHWAVINLLK